MKTGIKIFEERKVRTVWNEQSEEWYFSIVDVVAVLTDSPNPRKYWSVLKTRLKKEGNELTTVCSLLKMPSADGKNYMTDVASTNPDSLDEHENVAKQGGEIARNACLELEAKTGESVISPLNAQKGILKNKDKEIDQ